MRRGGSPEKERERATDTVNPSPPHLKGEMGPVVLWVCVCVCVWTVCVSTHFHFLHPQGGGGGGAWWSGLRRGGLLRKRERERDGYGKPLSAALLGGAGASGFVGMCVCVCGQCV